MYSQKPKKRQQYTRDQFSDKEVYNQIKDQIKDIRQRNLKQVEEDSLINKLYEDKKRQMKIMKMQTNKQFKANVSKQKDMNDLAENDEQEGEINIPMEKQMQDQEIIQDGAPSIHDLGQHIRPITITRNKMSELFKSRRFEETIKGCFVRYKSQNSNSYMLASILGIFEGQKQYNLNNLKVRTMLRLQQSSSQIIKLSLDHISNQHPPGNLQISKWLQSNRNRIPKQKQLKDKLVQLNNLIHGKISSHDIDKNLLNQADKVANDKGEGNENLNQLIFFMKNHVHDLTITIQQIQGNKDMKDKLALKMKQKKRCDEILSKLLAKQAQIKNQRQQRQNQQRQQRKLSNKNNPYQYIYNDRKQDKIRQVYQAKVQTLCTFQGANKIRSQLQQAHRNFDLEIDI